MRRLHAFPVEGSGRILNESDMVAKLHARASGGFDAGVRYKADEDDFFDSQLFKLGIEIGIGEAALPPVLKHDDDAPRTIARLPLLGALCIPRTDPGETCRRDSGDVTGSVPHRNRRIVSIRA